jgi:hypothetical protein
MNEWNIQSRAHACETCGHPFVDRQTYHTLLFDERAGLRRMDVCKTCWGNENTTSLRDHKGFLSYWHGVYEAPTPRVDPIQKDTAESLLRKLIAQNDPQHAPAAYILAVMLERKRLLKIKEQLTVDGRRVFVYEQPKTGDLFTIADPDLKLDQLAQVQHDVAHLLEHGLDLPVTPDTSAEVSAPAMPAEPPAEDAPPEPALADPTAPAPATT